MSAADVRPPPCSRCGVVESPRARRHRCSPAGAIMVTHGVEVAAAIAGSVVAAFAALRRS